MWVFGYGSLLWNPGFEVAESVIATLPGYARSFCMRSIHHRGTVDQPGLVLALDESVRSACEGMAMRVAAGQEAHAAEMSKKKKKKPEGEAAAGGEAGAEEEEDDYEEEEYVPPVSKPWESLGSEAEITEEACNTLMMGGGGEQWGEPHDPCWHLG